MLVLKQNGCGKDRRATAPTGYGDAYKIAVAETIVIFAFLAVVNRIGT
jgi:hypothetical protein